MIVGLGAYGFSVAADHIPYASKKACEDAVLAYKLEKPEGVKMAVFCTSKGGSDIQ